MTVHTWNPADAGPAVVLSNGNLTAADTSTNSSVRATVGLASGKWYWETTLDTSVEVFVGVGKSTAPISGTVAFPGHTSASWGLYAVSGRSYHTISNSYGSASSVGSVIGVYLDMDGGTLGFTSDGVDFGIAFTGITGTLFPMVGMSAVDPSTQTTTNFGATAFAHTPPAGYTAYDPPSSFAQTGQATGFSSTAFGTPSALANLVGDATGFCSTVFGTPTSGHWPAVGFTSTVFGTPIALNRNRVRSLGVTTRMSPLHYYAFNQTRVVTGFTETRVGIPTAVRFIAPDLSRTESVSAFRSTRFGAPAVLSPFTAVATGFTSTAFGAPGSRTSQRLDVTALAPQTQFGTPAVRQSQRAAGFRSTAFGTPRSLQVQAVTAAVPSTRFGTPVVLRSNTYGARGFCATRFGQPRAVNRFHYPVTGFTSTSFGTPTCTHRYLHVTGIAPDTRFGTPLLLRSPVCPYHFSGRASSLGLVTHFGHPTV